MNYVFFLLSAQTEHVQTGYLWLKIHVEGTQEDDVLMITDGRVVCAINSHDKIQPSVWEPMILIMYLEGKDFSFIIFSEGGHEL